MHEKIYFLPLRLLYMLLIISSIFNQIVHRTAKKNDGSDVASINILAN